MAQRKNNTTRQTNLVIKRWNEEGHDTLKLYNAPEAKQKGIQAIIHVIHINSPFNN